MTRKVFHDDGHTPAKAGKTLRAYGQVKQDERDSVGHSAGDCSLHSRVVDLT